MKINEIITEEAYQPPELEVGDKILKGKFKNSPAEITGFKKDKHNQPVLKTNKGDVQLFKPRVKKLMKESTNTNLLIIDVQPEYASGSDAILPGVQKMITQCNGNITVVFNDFGGGDTPEQVAMYLGGITEEDMYGNYDEETDEYSEVEPNAIQRKLQHANFVQKEYGFLRNWMDLGVSDAVIIEVMREMARRKITDSRDIPFGEMSANVQHEFNNTVGDGEWYDQGIALQDWVPIHTLKKLSPFYMMGGGRNECLREIELVCNAFNIRYKRVDSLIYG